MPTQTISVNQLKEWLSKGEAVVVDVREPAENAAKSIPGSKLVPLAEVCKSRMPLGQGKKVVVHCQGGKRGQMACEKLLAEDPSLEIYNLEGGIGAWEQSANTVAGSGKFFIPLDRQVLLMAGSFVFTASVLGYFVNSLFFLVSGFMGLGLVIAGLTGFCGGALLLAKMPWNKK